MLSKADYSIVKAFVFNAKDRLKLDNGVRDDSIIFFILLLRREKLLNFHPVSYNQSSINILIEKVLFDCESEYKNIYFKLWEEFNYEFRNVDSDTIRDVVYLLNSIDDVKFEENYSNIIDELLFLSTKNNEKFIGEYFQPIEITRLISRLCSYSMNLSVYNPFAGLGSYAIELKARSNYYAQEINSRTWALGVIRLMANNIDISNYSNTNSYTLWESDKLFDRIIASPPFNFRIDHSGYMSPRFQDLRTMEEYFLIRGIEGLKSNGKLIGVFSNGILFREGNGQVIRQQIVDNDILEIVISFSPGLLFNTGIPFSILVINKNKEKKGTVRFINAKHFTQKNSPKSVRLNDSLLYSEIISKNESEFVRIIPNDIIKNFDYNLNVTRYFQKEYEGVPLCELVTIIRGQKVKEEQNGKYIRIRDLKDNSIDFNLDINNIDNVTIPKNFIKIEESSLLLALRWKTLKPTYFEFTGIPIFISQDILAVKVDLIRLNLGYFINELNNNYTLDQLEAYRSGTTIPFIKSKDLFNVKIKMIPLSLQVDLFIQSQKEFLKLEEQKLDYLRKLNKIEIADQNSILRHQISGPLRNIRSSIRNIKKILQKHFNTEPSIFELKMTDTSELNFDEYFKILERDISGISTIIQKSNFEVNLDHYEFSRFDLIDLISKYYEELNSNQKIFDLMLLIDDSEFEDNNIEKILIKSNSELFRIAFDNIISNAEKHAFNNNYSIQNRIQILIYFDFNDMEAIIDISNSGIPVSKEFNLDIFSRRGVKVGSNSGDGLGLWYVNEIIKIHGGKFSFTNETDSEGVYKDLVSTFQFKFPIEIINKSENV